MKTEKLDRFEFEEFVAFLCELNYDDVDYSEIETALWDKFEISYDNLQRIIELLLPLIDAGKSPLTNKLYKGFSSHDGKNGADVWLLKMEVPRKIKGQTEKH